MKIDKDVIEGMIAAGFPDEKIAAARSQEKEEEFEVWPDNWRAVDLFRCLGTQWHISPIGRLMGLDYFRVESAMNLRMIPRGRRRKLFADIQLMEAAALDYLNEKAD